jgi:hypothetical protein
MTRRNFKSPQPGALPETESALELGPLIATKAGMKGDRARLGLD